MKGEDAPRYDGPSVGTSYRGSYVFKFTPDLTVHVHKDPFTPLIRLNFDMLQFIAKWEIAKEWENGVGSKTFSFDNRIIKITLTQNTLAITAVVKCQSHPILSIYFYR